jgi:hypothetical protein
MAWGGFILACGVVIGASGAHYLQRGGAPMPPPGMQAPPGPMNMPPGPGGQHRGPEMGMMPPGSPRQPAAAMQRPGPQDEAQRLTQRMTQHLQLTPEQADKVKEIYTRQLTALEAIRKDVEPRIVEQHEKLRQELRGVLEAGQFLEWDQTFQSMRRRMMGDDGPPPPPMGPGQGPAPGGERPPRPGMGPGPGPGPDRMEGRPPRGQGEWPPPPPPHGREGHAPPPGEGPGAPPPPPQP